MAKRKCPLVLIEWEDSMRPKPAWQHLHDMREPPEPARMASVGWLLHDTKRVKVLAPNMGSLNNEDNLQACGMIEIPTRAVIRVHKLREPV
jgi:hypothetical protein